MRARFIATAALVVLAIGGCGGHDPRPTPGSDSAGRSGVPAAAHTVRAARAQIREVIRCFNQAPLAGDSAGMCALVDPSKLRYLEQISQPCEVSLGGTLGPEAERDVRTSTITSIDLSRDDAVAHIRGLSGARSLRLHRHRGHWLIVGV